jgi:hypothetical protein
VVFLLNTHSPHLIKRKTPNEPQSRRILQYQHSSKLPRLSKTRKNVKKPQGQLDYRRLSYSM